jgi:hypothetical protein
MRHPSQYTRGERLGLTAVAAVGFFGLNGVFACALVARPDALPAALANPLAVAFIAEAFVMTGLLAYLFERRRVSRVRWWGFVLLSLLGGLAFAVPVALLLPRRPAKESDASR